MKMTGSHPTALAAVSLAMLLVPTQLALADANIQKRHVQMVTPRPYVWDEYGPTNPLNPDGSDYPCKVPRGGAFRVDGSPTEVVAGGDQVVSFDGLAVHGGGSCQFALAEGLAPTPGTAWSVIHSVEGGCPSAGAAGNLAGGQSPDNYTLTLPEGLAPGDYTFAWTWVNRIGGAPEFYMNCAPVTVKAAAGPAARARERRARAASRRAPQAGYPDLFLANIGDAAGGCDTSEAWSRQVAIQYPHPGDSVSHPDGTANLFKQPCDGNPRNGGAASNGTAAAPSASGGAAGTASTASTTGVAGATPTSSPSGRRSTEAPASSTSALPEAPQYSDSGSSNASATSSTAGPSGTASSLGSACTDGHLQCVGGRQFSTCTGGKWTALQDLASNARCKEEGEAEGLDITNVS